MTSNHRPDLNPPASVVVGVDGSAAGQAAVTYAVEAASRSGRPLRLVTAIAEALIPLDMRERTLDGEWQVLQDHEEAALRHDPDLDVRAELVAGDAVGALLDRSKDAALLVVGKRGLGTFSRMLLGSTSTGVAGRSPVPVAVVPTGWSDDDHADAPVVVGIDPEDDPAVLRAAFAAAAERRVTLEAVHAVDVAPQLSWDPELSGPAYRQRRTAGLDLVEALVGPLREKFPEVEATPVVTRGDAMSVLLDRSRRAGLLVLGQGGRHRWGFGLGSRARGVLHYAEVPVLVVPTDG